LHILPIVQKLKILNNKSKLSINFVRKVLLNNKKIAILLTLNDYAQ
jgi:hypothetical protein